MAFVKPKLTDIEADALVRLLDKVCSYSGEPDKVALSRVRAKVKNAASASKSEFARAMRIGRSAEFSPPH